MPEGDTVFTVACNLDRALRGQVIRKSDFRVPRYAVADLRGQTITGCAPRGKHLLIRTDAGQTVHSHLMMHGAWYLQAPGTRWRGGAGHEIRVVIETDPCIAVGYRLGVLDLYPTAEEAERLGHLGPDLLGSDWDATEAVRRLSLRPDRPVGEALLDQTCLAGIGNIYRCETLFLEGLHPSRAVADVPSLDAVVERARRLLMFAVKHGREISTGLLNERFYVYDRTGRFCRRCGTPVAAREGSPPAAPRLLDPDVARASRVVYWCPRCQPE